MRNAWKVDGHLATKTVEHGGSNALELVWSVEYYHIDLRTLELKVRRHDMPTHGDEHRYTALQRPARWDELAEVVGIGGELLVRARWAMSLADYEVDVRRHHALGHVSLVEVEDARLNAVWSAEAAVQVRTQLMKALEAFK